MTFRKSVPDEFGIIVPEDNGFNWIKQAGGFSCIQYSIEGVFVPLGRLKHNLGRPSWHPESVGHEDYINEIKPSKIPNDKMPNFPDSVIENDGFLSKNQCHEWVEKSDFSGTAELFEFVWNIDSHPDKPSFEDRITSVDPDQIPSEDYETLPDNIKENGFDSADTYFNWIDESDKYGWIELWDDAYRFTYGVFENLESDPRDRWDSEEELWNEIDSYFPFEYEKLSREEYREYDLPSSPPAIQIIRITSTEEPEYEFSTDFSKLEDQVVVLVAPNAD